MACKYFYIFLNQSLGKEVAAKCTYSCLPHGSPWIVFPVNYNAQ